MVVSNAFPPIVKEEHRLKVFESRILRRIS
jgi:hypothetical protein